MRWSVADRVRARSRGLTLVEMSLAIMVLGLVAVSVVTIFGAASDLVEEGRGRAELTQAGRAAMNRLLAELRMTVGIEGRSDDYLRVFCEGTTSMATISRRVTFWVEDGTLWRRVEGEEAQALAEDVTGLRTGGLTLWSTLDGVTSVTSPEVGPAGYFANFSAWRMVYFATGFWSDAGSGRRAVFPTEGVLDNACGTMEFWLKPDFSAQWRGADQDKYLIDTEDGGEKIVLFFDHSARELKFRVSGKEVKWEPTWAPGAVVHVALVWDCTGRAIGGGRTVALYVNGMLCEASAQTGTWSAQPFGAYFCLSQTYGAEAEAAFDNLRVYDYCKTDFRDRYKEDALGLMRVELTLESPDGSETLTLENGVWLQ